MPPVSYTHLDVYKRQVASVSRTIIPPLTIQFNKRYPKIGLSVMTQSITCIHEEVKERRLDMGIIIAFPNEVEALPLIHI